MSERDPRGRRLIIRRLAEQIRHVFAEQIVREVAARRGVKPHVIYTDVRRAPVVRARDEVMSLMVSLTGARVSEVARFFGMDHSTVRIAIERHRAGGAYGRGR